MYDSDVVWTRGDQDTATGVLARAVAAHGERPYLDFSGVVFTYADIDRESTRLARGLAALGVKPGDTVTSILDNNVDAVLAWFAINKLGAISVPVNTAYKGEFLRHQISDSTAKVVLAESDYVDRLLDIGEGLETIHTILHRGARTGRSPGAKTLAALEDHKLDGGDLPAIDIKPGDISMLIYTAGTTGPSKGCMISHNYACNLARQSIGNHATTPQDILWTALPLFHMNATVTTVLATAIVGARAAIYPRFSLSGFWPDILRSKATVASLLGSMIPLIAEAADTPQSQAAFGQLRGVGGAPFPAETQAKWKERFGVQYAGSNGYGFTEAAMVTTLPRGEYAKPGSSGRLNNDFDVRIVDDEDIEVAPNTPGEIICRPKRPHVMFEGYWNRPADTLKIMRNMWLHTGDIGKFDEDGFFFFLDRKKDYLRRRGENVSSFEMETTFRAHPDLEDVAVHAVLSELGEDDVKVTCILKEGAVITEQALCLWSIDHVPYFAVPRYVEFRESLPRNPVGRVLKYQLRDEGCTLTTWDRDKSDVQLKKR